MALSVTHACRNSRILATEMRKMHSEDKNALKLSDANDGSDELKPPER